MNHISKISQENKILPNPPKNKNKKNISMFFPVTKGMPQRLESRHRAAGRLRSPVHQRSLGVHLRHRLLSRQHRGGDLRVVLQIRQLEAQHLEMFDGFDRFLGGQSSPETSGNRWVFC